ncbi:MAG TPA: aryl-sulfate sulfotransferase [Isosphaeraceae bacterium]|jgi:hypothetical protein|nr:aryl-sulfate sulfotransferase [Isosphaeraceae bacterium]
MRLRLEPIFGRVGVAVATAALTLATAAAAVVAAPDDVPAPKKDAQPSTTPKKIVPPKLGLRLNDPKAFQGYTLLNPMGNKKAYLLDMQGRVVKTWETPLNSMHCAYLLEDGHLLRPTDLNGKDRSFGAGGGSLGRVQEYTWDGELVWDYTIFDDKHLFHHDVIKLPNGNYLFIVWEKKMADESIAAGRKKELVSKYVLSDSLVEVKPTGKATGEVVWEWHLWDHLIQDVDPSKPNYGVVADHPELVDINFVENAMGPRPQPKKDDTAKKDETKGDVAKKDEGKKDEKKDAAAKKDDLNKLKTIGYVASPQARSQRVNPDWTHINSVAYNADLDQILVSVHELSEIWIVDHGTTTAEAKGHTGGRRGKGGDLLYRWGNPISYRAGTKADQRLFAQHNAHWIPKGLPGAGHVLVFNNGPNRPDGQYSTVDEVILPADDEGNYRKEGGHFAPAGLAWRYEAPNKKEFFSSFISGAHRLPNGDTQICSGANGTIFEVTPKGETLWKYINPSRGGFRPGGPPGPQPPNQVLPSFLQDMLHLTDAQTKTLAAFQKEVDAKLDKALTDDQKKKLKEPSFGPGRFTQPGQIMSTTTKLTLKLTHEQRTVVDDLQKQADTKLKELLDDDQKQQFKDLLADFARGGPGNGPPGAGPPPGGPGGPGGPPPGGPGGPPGGGPAGGAALFRAYRYAPDYPGLAGRDLTPGKTVEEIQKEEQDKKDQEDKKKAEEKEKDKAKDKDQETKKDQDKESTSK